ncbi:Golgi transport complex subunit 5-domain-containing protein [Mucor mucedo]|uniref:Golgi transport complex subunit 5-domain-containing protein n=1 Tax=Mucor mucedo TaxID=29922 RepID=UPI00222041E2|nr:Golgi transport complex subunit 5-domain-containing protein [Mucor mucedo]KAI7888110.1 Golgi transport complex subunit 5-domain-containing protein [Mucor mucedo]
MSTIQDTDKYIDYDTFLAEDFDPNKYTTSIITEAEISSDAIDVHTELSKLAFSIDIVNKQIQEQVVANYEALLSQVTGIKELETVLNTVQLNIHGLNQSLQALAHKIRDPYNQLVMYATQLENMQITCELLRKLHRFILLKRRLEIQLSQSHDRDISTAALTLYELESILSESDFEGIDIVTCELTFIQRSRDHVQEEALVLLLEGIESQNQAKMAAGLQVFYNLKQMGSRVAEITQQRLNNLIDEIKRVVDMQSLQKELANTASSNVRRLNEPPIGNNQKQWAAAIWTRMESLMKNMSDHCIKVYSLEKVLELKKDPLTHVSFLEEVAKSLDATSLVSYFWRVLSANFEKELKDATKISTFLQSTLVGDYPKLLKLLHDFFARVAMHNGTSLSDYSQTPEYVIMLRSFQTFQSSFLSKSLQRMYDAVNSTFPTYGGLARTPPGRNNVSNITRIIGHELETASFEPNLSLAVAKNTVKTLSMFCVKCENLLPTNEQPVYSNTSSTVNYLNMNIEIANILYYMHQSIWKILEEYPEKTVDIVKKGVDDCHALMMRIGQHLVESIEKDVTSVLLKIHSEDFSGKIRRNFDPEDDSSSYMKELAKHVRYYHTTILQNLSCGAEPKSWAKQISKHILHVFIFQASLVRPLSEAGKLKLAGDMAELEFTISQFMSEYGARIEEVGDEYRALRAFRPLLFLDSAQLTAAHHTSGISNLILVHHLIVRSQQQQGKSLQLPNTVYDLSREEYMKWMDSIRNQHESVQLALDAITKGSKLTQFQLEEIPEYKLILQIASEE